jgi:hypothetical protein
VLAALMSSRLGNARRVAMFPPYFLRKSFLM